MNRQDSNRKILEILSKYIEDAPDIRFHQALVNINITVQDPEFDSKTGRPTGRMISRDQYNEEPKETLKRMEILNN